MSQGSNPTKGPKSIPLKTQGNKAIKTGDSAGGHTASRHVTITPGQMIDRLHGKDPEDKKYKEKQRKQEVTAFGSKAQANKAVGAAINSPKAQAKLSTTKEGATTGPFQVKLDKPVTMTTMKGPAPVKVGNKMMPTQGPAQMIKTTTNKVMVDLRKTGSGTGTHTAYPVPPKKK